MYEEEDIGLNLRGHARSTVQARSAAFKLFNKYQASLSDGIEMDDPSWAVPHGVDYRDFYCTKGQFQRFSAWLLLQKHSRKDDAGKMQQVFYNGDSLMQYVSHIKDTLDSEFPGTPISDPKWYTTLRSRLSEAARSRDNEIKEYIEEDIEPLSDDLQVGRILNINL